jgi:hypothetical protein
MILFNSDEVSFPEGTFYTLQSMAGLPELPPGKTAVGGGYYLFATPGAPVYTGSVSFQYLESEVLTEKANEEQLRIHFWDGAAWGVSQPYTLSTYYNLASARSQGPGVYALLAGVTTPVITDYTPSVLRNDVTTTLTITGANFLGPVQVVLGGSAQGYPARIASSTSITAAIPPGLPAREYALTVVNGDGGAAAVPGTLSLFGPLAAGVCFYDPFASGPNQWTRSGDWGIVLITPTQQVAMTDSPGGPYKNADDYGPGVVTYTTAITSQAFNLSSCTNPTLTFRHDYVIARLGDSQDVGRVEISTDDGATWTELARFSGGGVFGDGLAPLDVLSPEWAAATWKEVTIGLAGYSGMVRLRFSLEVNDDAVASKGWVIDDVMVWSSSAAPPETDIYLPVILKDAGPSRD